ncbi:12655_t:CDS:2, partial [Racocetra persica]
VTHEISTMSNEYIQTSEFPAPVISMQLKLDFKITCDFLLFDVYDDNSTLNNCSAYITQPTLNPVNGQYTRKFDPKNLSFPTNQTSERLKRILFKFDVINDTIVDGLDFPVFTINALLLYHASIKIDNTGRNATYYKSAASGFMIDPNDFVIDTQTEVKNKSVVSVISNILAMGVNDDLEIQYNDLKDLKDLKDFLDKHIYDAKIK